MTTSESQDQYNYSDTMTLMYSPPFLIQGGFRDLNINLWLNARKELNLM